MSMSITCNQPWRSFAAIINKCLSGKTTALENLRLSRAQILWGMYHNKQVDYVYLLDQAIPRRNKMFWHYARDDFMFTTIRVISKHKDIQEYSAILPQHLTNQAMLKSEAFKTYRAYATGEKAPKSKTDSESSPKTNLSQASKGKRIKTSAKGDKHATTKSKGLTILSEVAFSEEEQMKLATKRSLKEFHISHVSGSGDGVDILSKVPDEQQQTESGTNEGAGEDAEEDEEHDNDDNDDEDDVQEHDSQRTESDDSGDDFVHPNLSTYKADEEEQEKEEEKAEDDDEVISDQKVSTPPDYELTEEDENQQDDDTMGGEQEDEEDEELYGDLNINLNRRDAEMTDAQINQETEEAHVTLTTEPPVVQQQSSLFFHLNLVAKFINPSSDTAVASIPGIVDNYITSKMKDEVNMALQIIKEQVKAKTSKIMKKVEKYVTETLGAEVLVRSTNQPQTSYAIASSLLELELKKILMDNIEENKSIDRFDVQKNLYRALLEADIDKILLSICSSKGANISPPKSSTKSNQEEEHEPRVADLEEPLHQEFNIGNDVSPDREWNQTKTVDNRPPQQWMTKLAQASGTTSSFNEVSGYLPIRFLCFDDVNRSNTSKSNSRLLTLKPLPLIPDCTRSSNHPYDHFINNDLEYLKGGSSSRKYTTSITKTKAADYGYVKWIEDKIPRSTWSKVQVVYDKHAYWGTYSTRTKSLEILLICSPTYILRKDYIKKIIMIIAVTSLKIMDFFGYTHLEEITVRRQDDKLYKFREGDFKRLRREDTEDMLLLLIQGKLTNLNVDERFALNVALRMYTRRIVIQERVGGSTTGSIIYQDDMDRNRLIRTDELHKFSDGTLNHVRTSLNDIATGIQMEYLPKRKWSKTRYAREAGSVNLVDPHRFEGNLKMVVKRQSIKVKEFQRSFRHSTERLSRSDEVLKLKNLKKDATLKLFKSTNQERYEHVCLKSQVSQDGKSSLRWRRDYAWLMISRCSRLHPHIQVKDKGTSSIPKSLITTTYSQE
ncbi:hypothetical protein Tco_0630087 [Tanacetum coccineum]